MKCKGNEKEYQRIWQAKWRKDNPERVKEIQKRSREKNRDKRNEDSKQWREENREKYRESNRQHREQRIQFVNNYKLLKGCAICGYNECAAALVFHHRDETDKEFNIARNITCSLERLKKEMKKCTILCRNCHAVLHYKERQEKDNG